MRLSGKEVDIDPHMLAFVYAYRAERDNKIYVRSVWFDNRRVWVVAYPNRWCKFARTHTEALEEVKIAKQV